MIKNIMRALLGGAGMAAVLAAGVASPAAKAEDLKVGFVYVGPVGDHGWTYRHDIGRQAIEKELAGKVTTSFVENVQEGPDAERVIRQLASDGHKLIFTTSFGFMNPTVKVAKKFPDVKFEHATGYKRDDNVSTYAARFYEGRYVAGLIAGKMTKSGVIGYVGSFPIPEVVRGINAFTIALRSVNPTAEVKVVWVNSWYDPAKEGDAAKALIDQGADIILQHTDSPAPLQVAEARGVHGFGQASDMAKFAPKAQLSAIIDNWDFYYVARAKAVLDGTWKSEDTWGGIKSGMVEMAPFNSVIPADVQKLANDAIEGQKNGSVFAFTGPIKDQSGAVKVAAGEKLDDGALLGMDWYVEGVQGSLPK
ncbi:BMP family ABC transporter substrate-binding protein [Nisaea sp.]|jgi:simple sugar transport system substrate-binding protein|uniref:BMP family ABC transporter substrate-binding protein n=1 Tax=Nisaea sp. TaxID=2024842 RepID=UPI0025F25C73|nr:BMP family ABC transporter substrate-binding protein [Nisaea sp.]